MIIEMLKSHSYANGGLKVELCESGRSYDVPDHVAKQWIDRGIARQGSAKTVIEAKVKGLGTVQVK